MERPREVSLDREHSKVDRVFESAAGRPGREHAGGAVPR